MCRYLECSWSHHHLAGAVCWYVAPRSSQPWNMTMCFACSARQQSLLTLMLVCRTVPVHRGSVSSWKPGLGLGHPGDLDWRPRWWLSGRAGAHAQICTPPCRHDCCAVRVRCQLYYVRPFTDQRAGAGGHDLRGPVPAQCCRRCANHRAEALLEQGDSGSRTGHDLPALWPGAQLVGNASVFGCSSSSQQQHRLLMGMRGPRGSLFLPGMGS